MTIAHRGGRRVVVVSDDGVGFENGGDGAGQGLRNMRLRADSIHGGFSLRTAPGAGTAIEVVLRPGRNADGAALAAPSGSHMVRGASLA